MTESLASKVATFAADVPDWAVADALNAPDASLPAKSVKVPVSVARGLLLKRGCWGALVMAAENTALASDLRAACITARDTMVYLTNLDTDEPTTLATVDGLLGSLVTAGIVDAQTKADLLALASAPQSWADVNNGGVAVTSRDVGLARGAKE